MFERGGRRGLDFLRALPVRIDNSPEVGSGRSRQPAVFEFSKRELYAASASVKSLAFKLF